jgi:hypothetical protein
LKEIPVSPFSTPRWNHEDTTDHLQDLYTEARVHAMSAPEVVLDAELVDEPPTYMPPDVEAEYPGLKNLMDLSQRVGTLTGTLLGPNLVPDLLPRTVVGLGTTRSPLASPDLEFHRIEHTSATEHFSVTTVTTPQGTTRETHYTRYSSGPIRLWGT